MYTIIIPIAGQKRTFAGCVLASIYQRVRNTNNNRASTWWKKDMSFLRLKSIELGYSIPQSVTRKIHAKSIRFFVSGNNLFYLSKFKLWDPELDTVDGLKYPSMRSLMVGFDLNF